MPQLAQLASKLQPSATLALNSRIRELVAQGEKVWNFSVGEPDYTAPQGVIDAAVHSLHHDPIRYGRAGGGLELKKAVVDKLAKENRWAVAPDQVVCGVGAKQVLYHLMHALLDPGDQVMNHTPCWTSYVQQIHSTGAHHIAVPYLSREHRGQPFSPDYLEKFATPYTKAFLLCSPNNPAGYVVSEEDLRRLGAYLLEKDWWVISDEIYEYITFDHPHRSLIQLVPALQDRFIYVNGLSKGYAMTGWRVGYLVAPTGVAATVKALISHSSTCLPVFIEKAAAWALQQGPEVMKPHIEALKVKRDLALEILSGVDQLTYVAPEGAFYLYLDVRDILRRSLNYSTTDTLALCDHLLEKYRLGLLAGEAFLTPGFVRLSYAASVEDLREGLTLLKRALEKL